MGFYYSKLCSFIKLRTLILKKSDLICFKRQTSIKNVPEKAAKEREEKVWRFVLPNKSHVRYLPPTSICCSTHKASVVPVPAMSEVIYSKLEL